MRIFHVAWPIRKHVENSIRGIRRAARGGYDAIDLDLLITADNVIVVTHWDRPMRRDGFTDRLHRLNHDLRVRDMTWGQVQRLEAGGYRIMRVERALEECARDRVIAYFEPKGDARFEQDWPWRHIAAVAKREGTRVRVRAIRNYPSRNAGLRRVRAARRNGFRANTIRG